MLLPIILSNLFAQTHPIIGRELLHTIPSYFLVLFLVSLAIITSIKLFASSYLSLLFNSIVNTNHLYPLYLDGKFGFDLTNLCLDFNFILIISMIFQQTIFLESSVPLPIIITIVTAIYFLKLLYNQFWCYVFFDKQESVWQSLLYLLFTRTSGIFLLPLAFAGFYQEMFSTYNFFKGLLIILLILFVSMNIRLFQKLRGKTIGDYLHHFIYLCAFEISPFLLLTNIKFY